MNKTPEISIIFEEMAQLFFKFSDSGWYPTVSWWLVRGLRGAPWGLKHYPSERPNILSSHCCQMAVLPAKFRNLAGKWIVGPEEILSSQENRTDLAGKLKNSLYQILCQYSMYQIFYCIYTDNDHQRRKIDFKRGVKFADLNNIDVFYIVLYIVW